MVIVIDVVVVVVVMVGFCGTCLDCSSCGYCGCDGGLGSSVINQLSSKLNPLSRIRIYLLGCFNPDLK